jgi:hypothetical protein
MLAMTRTQGFAPSEAVLREYPMPQALFERVRQALLETGYSPATTSEQGRQQALQQCREQRAKRWHQEPRRVASVIHEVERLNQRLTRWQRDQLAQQPSPQSSPRPTVQIDNIAYGLDSLSDDAKAQLRSIQSADQELARLQAQVAALQMARNAYANALKASLPVEGEAKRSDGWFACAPDELVASVP